MGTQSFTDCRLGSIVRQKLGKNYADDRVLEPASVFLEFFCTYVELASNKRELHESNHTACRETVSMTAQVNDCINRANFMSKKSDNTNELS